MSNLSKLNTDLPVILIDTSYWLYYRFFSLRHWYERAYPDNYINKTETNINISIPAERVSSKPNNFNLEHNWLEDEIFMTKYKKLFVENIKKICKKFKTKMENVVFCIDCPHNDIWRHTIINTENEKQKLENEKQNNIINEVNENNEVNEVTNANNMNIVNKEPFEIIDPIKPYKGTRLESHKKNKFNSFNIFSYMKTKFIPTLKDNNNNNVKIIVCPKCEADDIIGQFTLYIQNVYIETKAKQNTIYILANDNDYLQVCHKNVKLINGIGKIISEDKGADKLGDTYLLSKILYGDKSDNIQCCSIDTGYLHLGIPNTRFKTISQSGVAKLLSHPEKYNVFMALLNDIRKNKVINEIENKNVIQIHKFKHNCIMMDFQMIPNELKENLHMIFRQMI
jgi:hypothetical protein